MILSSRAIDATTTTRVLSGRTGNTIAIHSDTRGTIDTVECLSPGSSDKAGRALVTRCVRWQQGEKLRWQRGEKLRWQRGEKLRWQRGKKLKTYSHNTDRHIEGTYLDTNPNCNFRDLVNTIENWRTPLDKCTDVHCGSWERCRYLFVCQTNRWGRPDNLMMNTVAWEHPGPRDNMLLRPG